MAVQLHYYGSVFNLDSRADDFYWYDFVDDALRECNSKNRAGTMSVTLEDGIQAWLPVFPGVPLVICEPREEMPGDSTFSGAVFWADGGQALHAADDD